MNRLLPPDVGVFEAYDACISIIADTSLKTRFEACFSDIDLLANTYIEQAKIGTLFSLAPLRCRKDEDPVVVGNLLKSELIRLYDYYMVQRQPARQIYDKILISANDKCPFCGGIGRPSTLDHYLPKANYPQFSIFPLNLVPACRDCNTIKRNVVASIANEQILHPYADDKCFFSDQWVFAKIVQYEPCLIEYYVDPPGIWDEVRKDRARKHFEEFDLAQRYCIQSAQELNVLADLRATYMHDYTSKVFSEYLQSISLCQNLFSNHWRRVMYQTLSADEKFCNAEF